jgi:hypothetical protein
MKNETKNHLLLVVITVLLGFAINSCGARKKVATKTEQSTTVESTDKSKIDKSENTESNVKKSESIIINNQNQTTTIEETVEPIDPTKEAFFTDKEGRKQSLVNGKKTTKTTVSNNNAKSELKNEVAEAIKTNKKESEAKAIKAKAETVKKADTVHVKREAVSLWNLAWLLIPFSLYLIYRNWAKINEKIWWI